jgi:hypothetical protein
MAKESDLLDHDGADSSGRNLAGLTYLSGVQHAVEGFARVAYPQQLRILLPIAKPLGTIALLIPGWPRLSRGIIWSTKLRAQSRCWCYW